MIKTQIQLPDQVYMRVKRLAERLEIPMAEVLRRGAEYMLRVHPESEDVPQEWRLPAPLDLGVARVPVESWRELANDPVAD